MTFDQLPTELQDALGAEALSEMTTMPEAIQHQLTARIMNLPDTMRAQACRELSRAARGMLSASAQTAAPQALCLLLALAQSSGPGDYMTEVVNTALSFATTDAQALAVGMDENGESGEATDLAADLSPGSIAAVLTVTAGACILAACVLLQLDADAPDNVREEGSDPENVARAAAHYATGGGREDAAERIARLVEATRERRDRKRGETFEADVLRGLDDLPMTEER